MQLTKRQRRWIIALIVISSLGLVFSSVAYSLIFVFLS